MASIIPTLSEKAKDELKIIAYSKKQSLNVSLSMNDGIEAFQDLFDLDKYPITLEMLFGYLIKSDFFFDNIVKGSTIEYFEFGSNTHVAIIKSNFTIKLALEIIIQATGKDEIIIIGDIHGWWEKPQTH